MKSLFVFFTYYLMAFWTACRAQKVNFVTYTIQDGLVSNPVRCIYQDSRGFVWIGTFEGLSRFDGYRFTNYTSINGLSHDFVNTIFETGNQLLVGHNNGAIDVFENNIIQKKYRIASAVNHIRKYDNRTLISTDANGFYEYIHDTLKKTSREQTNSPIGHFVAYNDTMLISHGIDQDLIVFNRQMSIASALELQNVYFYSFFVDSEKRTWACTSDGLKLLHLLPQKNNAIAVRSLPRIFDFAPLNNSPVTAMQQDKNGEYWIGTVNGLVHLQRDGQFRLFKEDDGLTSASISTLYQDREKNIWIGTELGLCKFVATNKVVHYNSPYKNFRNDIVSAQPLPNKKMMLHSAHGPQLFDLQTMKFTDISVEEKQLHIPVVGTSPLVMYTNGLRMYDIKGNKISPLTSPGHNVPEVYNACRSSKADIIFLGSGKGLYVVKDNDVQKILPYRITCLLPDSNGTVWAGTWAEGLFRISISQDNITSLKVRDLTSILGQKEIRSLFLDSKKNIWVGTRYGGAFCMAEKTGNLFQTISFDKRAGLLSNWVKCFGETDAGDIWIGTYLGLDKLVSERGGYRVFNFSKATNFFAEMESISSPGNNQWFCVANKGLAWFTDELLHKTAPPEVLILSASLGSGNNKSTHLMPGAKINLPPDKNAARFEFGSLFFMNEKQTRYSYRLKGSSDTSWSLPANIREASYESLPPGDYTFEVRALGWNGQNGLPASFSFFIGTPFWKQVWFIGLCLLVFLALVYLLYLSRIKQLMHLQKVRNSIATDLHDDIGSALTNISILAELGKKKNKSIEFTQNLPDRIVEESTLAQQSLDDIIWSVNSNNDTLNQTVARMRRYAAQMLEPLAIHCSIRFEDIPGDQKLKMDQRKDIYLFFKECLTNIIKHAGARNVSVEVTLAQQILCLEIADDGRGFDPLKATDRNGLKNIKIRLEKWNGQLGIDSTEGSGSVVKASFPLS